MAEENILLVGGGGHAHSCIHLAQSEGISLSGFYDDNEQIESVSGLSRLGAVNDLLTPGPGAFILGIGDHDHGKSRLRIYNDLVSQGKEIIGLVSKESNFIDQGLRLRSNQVFFRTFFGPDCVIGNNNIFNNGVIVEHQSKVGSHCHIGSGSILTGAVMLGDQVLIGANCTVLPGIEINTGNIIGAGSVINNSIFDSGGIYAGNPARKIGEYDYEL